MNIDLATKIAMLIQKDNEKNSDFDEEESIINLQQPELKKQKG